MSRLLFKIKTFFGTFNREQLFNIVVKEKGCNAFRFDYKDNYRLDYLKKDVLLRVALSFVLNDLNKIKNHMIYAAL